MGHDARMPVPRDSAPERPRPGPSGVDARRAPGVVLGVGASRGCPADELRALADATLGEAGLTAASVVAVASADVKADEPAVLALAAGLGVPARFLPAAALAAVDVPTPSAVVASHVGTPSVAEAAALLVARELFTTGAADRPDASAAVAGDHHDAPARLVVPKRRSAHATCAVARVGPPASAAPRSSPDGAPATDPDRPGRPGAPADRPPVPTEVPLP